MSRVAVLSGGLSLERDVSLRSGARVAGALADQGYEVTRLDLDADLVESLSAPDLSAVFLALHGRSGENGTIQSLLDVLDLPYTGPDARGSALAWNKPVCKAILTRGGIPTPGWATVTQTGVRDFGAARLLDRIGDRLGAPMVVKPAEGGASLGVRVIGDASGLSGALMAAFSYHDSVLVERFVAGTEVAVSLVDGEPLPAVEIAPKGGAYDYSARYTAGATEFYSPARLGSTELSACGDVARQAWELLGLSGLARADLIVDESGTPWLLEFDTCPGMTETSLFPMAAEAAGWTFGELCRVVVERASSPA